MSRDEQARLRAIASGSALDEVYGKEWCLFPEVEMRKDLGALLEALRGASGGEADAKVEDGALLPCPFCGGPAEIQLDRGRNVVGVGCQKCVACQVPSWSEEKWAIAAWNTRAPDHPAENAKSSGDRTGAEIAQVGDDVDSIVNVIHSVLPNLDVQACYRVAHKIAAMPVAQPGEVRAEGAIRAADALALGPNGSGGMKITLNFAEVESAGAAFSTLSDVFNAALARSGKGEG